MEYELTIEGYSEIREEYVPVTVKVEMVGPFWALAGFTITKVDGNAVHPDHASVWADELGITDDQVERAALREIGE